MVGPIGIFMFMAFFPHLFRENTLMFWHYFSAFGIFLYVPLGAVVIIGGFIWRHLRRSKVKA
jgi:hypothetical protein